MRTLFLSFTSAWRQLSLLSQSYWSPHTEHSEDFLKGHCWLMDLLVGFWCSNLHLELNFKFSFYLQWPHVRRLADLPCKDPRLQALTEFVTLVMSPAGFLCADPGVHHRRPAGGRMRFSDLLCHTEQLHWGGTLGETNISNRSDGFWVLNATTGFFPMWKLAQFLPRSLRTKTVYLMPIRSYTTTRTWHTGPDSPRAIFLS